MKSLLEIYLSEQDEPIDFAEKNLSIHPDKQNNSFLIVPTSKKARNIRSIINQVKQRFEVTDIQEKQMNTFEVFLDPAQDLDEVLDFLTKEIEKLH